MEDEDNLYDLDDSGVIDYISDEEFLVNSDNDEPTSEKGDTEDISILINTDDDDKFYKLYDISNYKTQPILTKFEKTQILSERITHLSNGCKPYINISNESDLYDIALDELNNNKLPYIIKRTIGNTIEYWKLSDLIK